MTEKQIGAADEAALREMLDACPSGFGSIALRLTWREGLKLEEIRALTWEQVDFDGARLRLPGRDVPLEDESAEALRQWREALRARGCDNAIYVLSQPAREGRALYVQMRRALEAAGLAHLRMDTLRLDFVRRAGEAHGAAYAIRVSGISVTTYRKYFGLPRRNVELMPKDERQERLWRVLQECRTGSAAVALWLMQQAKLKGAEIVDLTWDRVDLERGILHLARGDVYMIKEVISVLRQEKESRAPGDDPHVVLSAGRRRPVTRGQLSLMMRDLLVTRGLGEIALRGSHGPAEREREYERIRQIVREKGQITQPEARDLLGIADRAAYARLRELTDAGELVQTAVRIYIPAERAVPKERQEEAVLRYLAGHPFIREDDVRALLVVSHEEARKLLWRMEASGKLARGPFNMRCLPGFRSGGAAQE